jgi:hypothetical protein
VAIGARTPAHWSPHGTDHARILAALNRRIEFPRAATGGRWSPKVLDQHQVLGERVHLTEEQRPSVN